MNLSMHDAEKGREEMTKFWNDEKKWLMEIGRGSKIVLI